MSRGNPDESGQRRRRAAHNAIVLPTAAALGESEVARNPRQEGGGGRTRPERPIYAHASSPFESSVLVGGVRVCRLQVH